MKKLLLYAVSGLLVFTSCEDFLDTENYTKKNTSNFPETLEDAQQMIAGIYVTQISASASADQTSYVVGELASDDRFGGGGENDKKMQAADKLMTNEVNMLTSFWTERYKGIFRANMAVETIDNCVGFTSEEQKNQMKGEVYFLRALFYNDMAELFGNVPLVLTTETQNLPKAEADEIYGQIAYDLKTAIELMPSKSYTSVESGHATKWDAQAMMARAFLFYTGFYGKESMPIRDTEGNLSGSITKDQVIAWLEDCINNSGHDLLSDFRALWSYSNNWTAPDYPYVENVRWAGDGQANKEKMFSIKHSSMAKWATQHAYSNKYSLFFSLRANNGAEGTFPFGRGWGAGPVNTTIWNEWKTAEPTDMRREASIADMENEVTGYQWGQDAQVEETGFWAKKYMNYQAYDEEGTRYDTFGHLEWNADNDIALGNPTDLALIRFADVLLMHSELKQDVMGINRVRQRAGLDPITGYTLDVLKKERRFELAFEGRRWADIRRWGDAPALLDKQLNVSIKNLGADTQMKSFGNGYSARYEETKGFFPIPESQITLSGGVLTQNPGWGSSAPNALFSGW
ncbi:RagB/SusD family nutrient uptake outer membrane protein [Parabacteroides sp. PF5-9]|uniref:RagB/SusD family nutrient uptake outer membrane protein n=1 Tax=Parabacteroides sp. PF5-9 TaxID=1742404 RepID=UPI002476C5BD|nr:RagB/SusD family nutrient uptake outer membrane protein [Parabacteroides sp. PF5-9]MDH6356601.1 hypothetical protein [Parabacteroides sp. PF5-9]